MRKQEKRLLEAIKSHDLVSFQKALENMANIECKDDSGKTPLMYAALGGHLEVVQGLLDLGANLDMESLSGETALGLSLQHGHPKIALELILSGAKIDESNDPERNTLCLAQKKGYTEIEKEILEYDHASLLSWIFDILPIQESRFSTTNEHYRWFEPEKKETGISWIFDDTAEGMDGIDEVFLVEVSCDEIKITVHGEPEWDMFIPLRGTFMDMSDTDKASIQASLHGLWKKYAETQHFLRPYLK